MSTAAASSAAVAFFDTPGSAIGTTIPDDLARDVYSVLGLPIDAIELPEVLHRMQTAAVNAAPYLVSTVNVNFFVNSAVNAEFRESVLLSDLCPADGMPLVWIARLLGMPIKQRIAGSDIFDALKTAAGASQPLKLFLFGGADGVATAAANAINAKPGGLCCVGSIYPGVGSADDMSQDAFIDAINASQADSLIVALGAAKGQTWLLRNHHRLRPPVRSHFGAAINFTAGTVKRAPLILRRLGLEWLWRIKEEPQLWRRYCHDARVLLGLIVTRILPLAIAARWQRIWVSKPQALRIDRTQGPADVVTLRLTGDATAFYVTQAISCFRGTLTDQKQLLMDLSAVRRIDARFFGLFLMLRKRLNSNNVSLKFIGVSPRLATLFWLNGVEFLLSARSGVQCY
jgi:N-acetylglucosaminyldiphosphoundecaprenol N-acetyl-beta-D-mannosaminyltransferase